MFKEVILVCLFFGLISPVQAGIDEEFGEKPTWWKSYYNQFLSNFGFEKSYALVIGVSNYKDNSFQSLPSEKDAMRIKDYLINEAGFDHVRLITGDKVNANKVRKLMFDHYPKLLKSTDRFLFYWSGHGVTTGDARKQGYLAVQNSHHNLVSSMVSMQDLSQWDRRIKAKQTLYLLDACFSGIAASKAMSVSQNQTIERVSRPSSQVLTAGLENEQTIAISDINGGVFTRALLDGLRGHADTDKGPFKKDGIVTARELEAYVRIRVDHERRRVHWDKPITPVLYNFSRHEGDFFFISDKRVLKKPLALKQGNKTKIIATGVKIHHLSKLKAEYLSYEPEMKFIRGGRFQMGSPIGEKNRSSNETQHMVEVSDFWIGKKEVTFNQWQSCVDYGGCQNNKKPDDLGGGRGNHPVFSITWLDAYDYTRWLSRKTGKHYRLPTEAEWEYAARGKSTSSYHFGNNEKQLCLYGNNANKSCNDGIGAKAAIVGQYKPNQYGLYDMIGNVWELTCSVYNKDYNGSEKQCAKRNDIRDRVMRGGSWDTLPLGVRSASRTSIHPLDDLSSLIGGIGFRLVRIH